MYPDNQADFRVPSRTVDVLFRHTTRLKRSKDYDLLAFLGTLPDSQYRAKLGPGWANRGKAAKLTELQQALEELSVITKRAIAILEQGSAERRPVVRKTESSSSSSPPLSRAPSPRTPSPPPPLILPDTKAQEDRKERFREVAAKITSTANRKRYMEIVPHITGPLPGDDDDERIRFRGQPLPPPRSLPPRPPTPPSPPPPPPQLSQKSLPAVPV